MTHEEGPSGKQCYSPSCGAERRAGHCCSCPSVGAVGSPTDHAHRCGTCYVACPWDRVDIQALRVADRVLTQTRVVPDEHVQHGGNERAEHRRPSCLCRRSEPADRFELSCRSDRRPGCRCERGVPTDETGQASGWFFQYPGVPVPGSGNADVYKNPKLASAKRLAEPTRTLTPRKRMPSLSMCVTDGGAGRRLLPGGIWTAIVYVSGGCSRIDPSGPV